jgi:hypothetical protein
MKSVLFCPGCNMHSIRANEDSEECIVCSNRQRPIIFKKRCAGKDCANPIHPDHEYVISLDVAVLADELPVVESDLIEATRRIVQTISVDHDGALCQECLESKVGEAIGELGIELLQGVAGERRRAEFEEEWE